MTAFVLRYLKEQDETGTPEGQGISNNSQRRERKVRVKGAHSSFQKIYNNLRTGQNNMDYTSFNGLTEIEPGNKYSL